MDNEEKKKPSLVKRLLRAAGIALILAVYLILMIRFFVSCDADIVDELLKTPAITAAYETYQANGNSEAFEIQQYEVTDWYKSKDRAGDTEQRGGKLLSVSNLYYIPAAESLQITVKFNLDILENRETDYSAAQLPFSFVLEDESGNLYTHLSAVKYAERYSFGYIRLCFDGIRLEKDDGSVDENGLPQRKNYEMYLYMLQNDGTYSETVYDQFSIYTGSTHSKAVAYR